ncbi:MAG TPA: peptidase E, partial [Solirubrobacteraceae bacterium]|nr:peptidase E [Solirubrobacteraceae bacterium]
MSAPPSPGAERRAIFAMGGGGFTMEPTNPLLDDFVLSLSRERDPRILFLPTASGDTTTQINAFYARFGGRACKPSHISLFRLGDLEGSLREVVLAQDIVYVGGGSMRNLLALWGAHELDRLLIDAWEQGTVLAGISAGAMCWFEGGITRSSGPPEPFAGLGLLPGSLTVHADGEPERLPVWL